MRATPERAEGVTLSGSRRTGVFGTTLGLGRPHAISSMLELIDLIERRAQMTHLIAQPCFIGVTLAREMGHVPTDRVSVRCKECSQALACGLLAGLGQGLR